MASGNIIENVAIIGASGNVGRHFAEELLKTGKHVVTAITRAGSKAEFPTGVKPVRVNYDDEATIVDALKGQQMLVITLSVSAPPDTHSKLVKAAVNAGVPYIMPNIYGGDIFNKSLSDDHPIGARALQMCEEIETLGATHIAMCCGFWYEWSLALGEPWFGFDIKNRTVTFFDDGKTKTNISTWQQCGRALAALLSLPECGTTPSVSDWKNKPLYISSFSISQRDMLDSLNRILGTTDQDWTITYEPTAERYANGIKAMQNGDRRGFARAMYSRVFYPNGDGHFESKRGLANDALGLPKEDLDEATKRAVEMVESGWNPFAQ